MVDGGEGVSPAGRESRRLLVARLAEQICERKMSAPAIFFFESIRPLNFVASQTMHALAPLMSLFVDPHRWESFAEALEERETIELLIDEIEKKEQELSKRR